MEKFVLCRPQGGLNDNLCQIEACWRYCERTGRTLVVDTSRSGGFGLPFGFFFQPAKSSRKVVFHPSNLFLTRLNGLTALPACTSGRLAHYYPVYEPAINNIVDRDTRVQLSFDMEKDYPEPLLVHDQYGGGTTSTNCLARLRLTNDFKRDVLYRLSSLSGKPYHAVVIRNSSDYQTDYQSVLAKIHPEVIGKRLLVCSDHYQVIAFAKAQLIGVEVLELRGFVHTHGMPVANYSRRVGDDERHLLTLKAVSDLIALAQSEKLFISKIKKKLGGVDYSVFTMLSAMLSQNKAIVAQLLGANGTEN